MKNKPLTNKDLELGQIAFGNPVGEYQSNDFIEALLENIFNEIERVYWNKNQVQWDQNNDPDIKGIEFKRYYWGDDEKEKSKPNFTFKKVEIRWYKHPFRSATVNVSMTEKQWIQWFYDCLGVIRKSEVKPF